MAANSIIVKTQKCYSSSTTFWKKNNTVSLKKKQILKEE